MNQHGEQSGLIRPCSCCKIPEIGIERLIAGGSDEAHQAPVLIVEDAQVPDAALQCQWPSIHRMGLIPTILQQ